MRLILEARHLPELSVVFKPTGEKPLTLRDSIKVHGEMQQEITAAEGVRFLVSENGGVTAIKADSKVAIEGDPKNLVSILQAIVDRDSS